MAYATAAELVLSVSQAKLDLLPHDLATADDAEKLAYWQRLLEASAYEMDGAFSATGTAVPLDPSSLASSETLATRMTEWLKRVNIVLAAASVGLFTDESPLMAEAKRYREKLEAIAKGEPGQLPGLDTAGGAAFIVTEPSPSEALRQQLRSGLC